MGQETQTAAPLAFENMPGGQRVELKEENGQKEPAGQGSGAPDAQKKPAAHGSHVRDRMALPASSPTIMTPEFVSAIP
jgi:hypothetical protein